MENYNTLLRNNNCWDNKKNYIPSGNQ